MDVVRLFIHTTRCKLQSYTVVYTSAKYLALNVMHNMYHYARLVVHDIDALNVGPPPACLSPM